MVLTSKCSCAFGQKREDSRISSYSQILRYGACKGAPLTHQCWELLRQQRDCTRAALRGFARARRRGANGVGLPRDVVVSILVMAGLEVEESFGYSVHV